MPDSILDATGMRCPIPVLKARKAVRRMSGGETIEILATDPGAIEDFDAFCETGGHEMVSQSQDGEVYRFIIRIGG